MRVCKCHAYCLTCFLLGSSEVENRIIILYFPPPPALCWIHEGGGQVGDLKTGSDILGRDHLLVEVPHANVGWLPLNRSGCIFRERQLCCLPYALPLSLSQVWSVWMRSQNAPTTPFGRAEECSWGVRTKCLPWGHWDVTWGDTVAESVVMGQSWGSGRVQPSLRINQPSQGDAESWRGQPTFTVPLLRQWWAP